MLPKDLNRWCEDIAYQFLILSNRYCLSQTGRELLYEQAANYLADALDEALEIEEQNNAI